MKRIIALFLLISLMLAACGNVNPDPADDVPTPSDTDTGSSATDETTQVNTVMMPMITVSVPVVMNEKTADDGAVIFRGISQSMQLIMPDQEVADRIIIDFLSRIDNATSDNEGIIQQAQNNYDHSENWNPYFSSITYAPKRIDQSVLSLYGNSIHFSGGAHAEIISRAANYNVLTGDVLTLGSILVSEKAVDDICALVIEQLTAVKDEKYIRDGFEETVQQRFASEESYDENWYFSTNGLCFYFDHYAIAPYSSGVITAEIPYEDLVGIIDDSFFPPEVDGANGTVTAASANDVDMQQFSRISEVILKNEAPMYVIYTDGAVQNLRIEVVDAAWNGYYTVFAAQTLCEGDAIVVQADVSLFSQLTIVYESNGQTVILPLLES